MRRLEMVRRTDFVRAALLLAFAVTGSVLTGCHGGGGGGGGDFDGFDVSDPAPIDTDPGGSDDGGDGDGGDDGGGGDVPDPGGGYGAHRNKSGVRWKTGAATATRSRPIQPG
ncbi:MAG TPA: hypothetical protein VGG22_10230 [Candidatus Baltobacteraceae bacterium]